MPTRRLQPIVKPALFGALLLALFWVGHRGRQRVRTEIQVQDVRLLREQLQQTLDSELRPATGVANALAGPESGSPPTRPWLVQPGPAIQTAAASLRERLAEFPAGRLAGGLTPRDELELRLARATLAIAERRFSEALSLIEAEDRRVARSDSGGEPGDGGRELPVIRVLADASYGLERWAEALPLYQRRAILEPDPAVAQARIADCLRAQGRRDESLAAYRQLAELHQTRGDARLADSDVAGAMAQYDLAIEIQTAIRRGVGTGDAAGAELARLLNRRASGFLLQRQPEAAIRAGTAALDLLSGPLQDGWKAQLAEESAVSQALLGDSQLLQGKPGLAVPAYDGALREWERLVAQDGRRDLADRLAITQLNLGNALVGSQRLDEGLALYEKCLAILIRLTEEAGRADLVPELAMCRNNRGVVRRAQGRLGEALADFNAAIEALTAFTEAEAPLSATAANSGGASGGSSSRPSVRLQVAVGFSERSVEMLTRSWLVVPGRSSEYRVALAMSRKNRGYAHLKKGDPAAAIEDFTQAAGILGRLVGQEGQRDLASQWAKTLCPLAWILATHPDGALRNGTRAMEVATQACQLVDWKYPIAIETLAAACAETGEFQEAVQHQERAVALTPRNAQASLLSRLALYRAGKPFRTGPGQTE